MILSIHHVSLTVSDLDRSIAFYRHLGFELASDRRDLNAEYLAGITGYPGVRMHVAFLTGFNVRLELVQYLHPAGADIDKQPKNTGSTHLCFEVDDLHAAFEQLRSMGVRFRSEAPVEIHEGPNAGRGAFYFLDPDGFTMEIAAELKPQKEQP